MKFGYIQCEDNKQTAQKIWLNSFELIFRENNIIPHVINDPSYVKDGYTYIWRPSAANFLEKYKNTKELSEKLSELARTYESKGAAVFPSSKNIEFYENKLKIHEYVKKHNIKAPSTYHFKSVEEALSKKNELPYPLILKHAYSCNSQGIDKADTVKEYEEKVISIGNNISNYIVQQRLKIKRDVRVNYAGNQTILAYSRFIATDAISSASRFKSKIDHFNVPYKAYDYAYAIGKLFDCPFGGIDMVWENDDIKEAPYLLEISPMFDLNPMPMAPVKNWARFKRSFSWNKYYKQAILQAANLQISYLIELNNK